MRKWVTIRELSSTDMLWAILLFFEDNVHATEKINSIQSPMAFKVCAQSLAFYAHIHYLHFKC